VPQGGGADALLDDLAVALQLHGLARQVGHAGGVLPGAEHYARRRAVVGGVVGGAEAVVAEAAVHDL
jgi:hypothetical protein